VRLLDLKPPECRHNGAVIRDSVKEAADPLRCLVAVDPAWSATI